jgi:integrase
MHSWTRPTGCRKSELLALRWEHVDFWHHLITVEAAYAKNGETRSILMTATLTETLGALKGEAKTIAMTMRYTHLAPGHKRTAIAVLDRVQEKIPSIFPTGRKKADRRAV